MARVIEVFPEANGVIQSVAIKTADGVLQRPAVKPAPVIYECFRDKNSTGDVGARDLENIKTWKLLKPSRYVWSYELANKEALTVA